MEWVKYYCKVFGHKWKHYMEAVEADIENHRVCQRCHIDETWKYSNYPPQGDWFKGEWCKMEVER